MVNPTLAASAKIPASLKRSISATSGFVQQNYILLQNQQVTLNPSGANGTATVNALDITADVSSGRPYTLDLRAEDCGGTRQMSDIYLVFQ